MVGLYMGGGFSEVLKPSFDVDFLVAVSCWSF